MEALSRRTDLAERMVGGTEETQHVPLYAVS